MRADSIRNFCIVAHIDHGKSTLADRLLELTGTITARESRQQFLDSHAIERERGITIKAKAVAMRYDFGGEEYQLNLIDTPGHVDFTYEVSRSLAACEGAILLVDATQGVQAQTVANAFLAMEARLEIIPVVNKIDSPLARVDEVIEEMVNSLAVKAEEVLQVSAKTGAGCEALLERVIRGVPPPKGRLDSPLRALIFDSVYDEYRAVVVYTRVVDGVLRPGEEIRMMGTGNVFQIEEVGKFRPKMAPVKSLEMGEVGYVVAGIKNIRDVKIGDTVAPKLIPAGLQALPGYREPLPMVFCGFYPTNDSDFKTLKQSIERLSLNDSSFTFQPETSEALGFGFRCGFLGLLHLEIVQERLERDEGVEVIQTAPNVTYEVMYNELGETKTKRVDNPADLPEEHEILEMREPISRVAIIVPKDSVGPIMALCMERRGVYVKTEYISPTRAMLTYDIPFAEIVFDFYDKMKSLTRGYGTMDYHILGYKAATLVRLDILVAGDPVDALSTIVHKEQAELKGRRMITVLRREIPRHLFEIPLQASIGKRIVARETIRALAKNVTAKCYGGDISRKRKLWEKQKEGKKKMKNVGRVEIPQKAFMAVLTADRE
ncbi:MAG: elongation factor 4 [Planctomycetes bacterium]|nr:elongation factor 4 [Planctomycetota bacterium]